MFSPQVPFRISFVAIFLSIFGASQVTAQSPRGSASARAVLGAQIDDSQTVALRGHVRADLTPQRDLGATEDARPMQLSLLLARAPEQQAELDALIAQQQQPGSPMYHQWLTPQQFGERFGAAQADIAKLTAWLESHGFQVQGVLNNGSILRFRATAGQVRDAFKTEIHYWNVQGGRYAANIQDPLIPAAMAGLVTGIHGLNQIPLVSYHTATAQAAYDAQSHKWTTVNADAKAAVKPGYNAGSGNYYVTPQDFYTIYDVNKVFTGGNLGAGATVAVVEQSDIQYGTVNSSTGAATGGDVATFRSLFGVSGTLNMKVMHGAGSVTCNDPGIVSGDESEATLDAEWANALAPSAQLIFMACDNTVDNGVITSLTALIDNDLGNVLSLSYGSSELTAVSSDYTLQDSLFQQAAAQGQTMIVSAGDSGSDSNDQDTSGTAISGLNVDVFAASPLVLGAGGTDFSDLYDALEGGVAQTTYWSNGNTTFYGDALSYIPETPWNDSCASSLIAKYEGYTGAGFCGVGTGTGFVSGDVVAGGGGFSTHYSQPTWQTGTLGVSGSKRAVPDISMFAANGVWGHALVYCDSSSSSSACTSPSTFGLAGGTSFVAPALAGVTGLLVTATHETQGTLNPALYALARAQFSGSLASSCYSNGQTGNTSVTTSLPAASCVFHDITTSNNDVPCKKGSLSCYVNSGKTYGMLSTTGSSSLTAGFASGAGYDEATGLGSVDVYNLIAQWNRAFTSSTTLVAGASSIASTGSDQLTATVTGGLPAGSGSGAPALQGTVGFYAGGTTSLGGCQLVGNSCYITVAGSALAAGANSITATYSGNGTYPSSTSSPVTVTVTGGTSGPASPAFSPAAGTYVSSVQVTLTDATPGAVIYYTINGGSAVKYTGAITVTASETLQAVAVVISGSTYTTSAPQTAAYTILQPPAMPVISPGAGSYTSAQTVTITDSTAGATIYYAINGGTYTQYTGAISLSASESISAYASITSGGVTATSQVNLETYQIVLPPAAPVISPGAGGYTSAQTVTITDSTAGATIYYAINGGAYNQYTGSFSVSTSESISAYASVTAGGVTASSATTTQAYTIVLPPAAPAISPGAGSYTSVQTVTITDSTAGATIYYAINGGAYTQYTGTFSLSASETISAYASLTSGGVTASSAVTTQSYTVVLPPAMPAISPGAGSYTSVQTVTITDTTAGATIYYSINGGAYAQYTAALTVSASESISAYASVTSGGVTATSPINMQTYQIVLPPAVPVISPAAGNYSSVQTVTITDSTAGATIYYAINGGSYVQYTGSFSLSASETISAYASVTAGGVTASSAVTSQSYTVVLPPANPTFSPTPGTYTGTTMVTLSDATPGALVFYSLNGSKFTQYTSPISLAPGSTYTIMAVAYEPNGSSYVISSIVKGVYTIN